MSFKALCLFLLLAPTTSVFATTLSGGRLVEDFSTDDFADYTATTGLWNIVDHIARAGAVVAGNPLKTMSFGNGSDGSVNSSSGYAFNTDAFPNGYNFKSVNISGGVITVTGSNPLIIRSLTTVTITPALSVNGGNGSNGSTVSSATVSGGTAVACRGTGGSGGSATGVANADVDGGDGVRASGATEAGTQGLRGNGANATDANAPITGPAAVATWDTAANAFICGTGGGGGGGSSPGGGNFSTGAGGGAGGGAIRILSIGDLTVGAIDVRAGDGGLALANGGATCSGHGSGGVGGAAWLQTLKSLTSPVPTTTASNSGTGNGCGAGAGAGVPGRTRGDAEASLGAFAATSTTANAAPNLNYVVQSKAYDLGTLNAKFSGATVTSQANGGSATVSYAGSVDGTTFSSFSGNILDLNGKNYRYLKFKVDIATAGVAGASPQVSQVAIDFSDGGIEKLELKLSAGCGLIKNISGGSSGAGSKGKNQRGILARYLGFWTLFWILAYGALRYGWVMTMRRAMLKLLPAKSRPEMM